MPTGKYPRRRGYRQPYRQHHPKAPRGWLSHETFLRAARRFFLETRTPCGEGRDDNPCSIRSCAKEIGVSDRTIRRWLAGEDWPDQAGLTRLAAWFRARKKQRA